jgi:hypothetical protein
MGVNLCLGCGRKSVIIAHWAYNGFHRFREKLAREIGINLNDMEGFGGDTKWTLGDPIVILLRHPDCEGIIESLDCGAVGNRVLKLIHNWDDTDYDKIHGTLLGVGMIICAANGIDLLFR